MARLQDYPAEDALLDSTGEEPAVFWQVAVRYYDQRANKDLISLVTVHTTSNLAVAAALAELEVPLDMVVTVAKRRF